MTDNWEEGGGTHPDNIRFCTSCRFIAELYKRRNELWEQWLGGKPGEFKTLLSPVNWKYIIKRVLYKGSPFFYHCAYRKIRDKSGIVLWETQRCNLKRLLWTGWSIKKLGAILLNVSILQSWSEKCKSCVSIIVVVQEAMSRVFLLKTVYSVGW